MARKAPNPEHCPHPESHRIQAHGHREYCARCFTEVRRSLCPKRRPDPRELPDVIAEFEEHERYCELRHETRYRTGWPDRIVATSMAKGGGPCAECGKHIPKGGGIFKLESRRWIGKCCADRHEEVPKP